MIAERVMYHVVCDGCGADAQEGSDYVAWAERATARYEPFMNGWGTDGADRDLCQTCAACSTCSGSGRVADPGTAGHPATDDVACPTCDGA